jgi:thiol-disulfide isomerase/thioredoxin
MVRHPKIIACCALGMGVFLFLALGSRAADARKESPVNLNLNGMDGRKVHLRDFSGKNVVLNFWATWCLPCREEMPMMVDAAKMWAPKGVVFIGASLDDNSTKKKIPAFLKEFNVGFPVWTGATVDDMARLRLGDSVPDTVFLDGDRVIFARVRGEIRRNELDERLDWVTGNRTRPAPQALVVHLDK